MTLHALREHGQRMDAGSTLWAFKNDNQEPWLRVTVTRAGIPVFLRKIQADPDCRRAWSRLAGLLTERDSKGQVKASGADRAAKTLFDRSDQPGTDLPDSLLRRMLSLAADLSRFDARALLAWRALCRLYLEVMYGMDTGQVKPARELITQWITQEKNPRGRFNEYARAAASSFRLQKVLMSASARLLLDGQSPPDISGIAPALLDAGHDGWRLRGLLFFGVVADLAGHDVPVGQRAGDEEDEVPEDSFELPDDAEDQGQ